MNFSFSPRTLNIWKLTWMTFFWSLWNARNAAVYNGVEPRLVSFIMQLWVSVKECVNDSLGFNHSSPSELSCMAALGLRLVPIGAKVATAVR